MYSGTANRKGGTKSAPRNPSNLPSEPVVMYSAKAPGVIPVPKSICIVLRIAANHGDKGVEEQDYHQQHLADCEPELCFTEPADCADVDHSVQDDAGQADCPYWYVVSPKCQDEREC